MSGYARQTTVSVERSMQEIRKELTRFGAERFGFIEEPDGAQIAFEYHGVRYVFRVPLPTNKDAERAYPRTYVLDAVDKLNRARWRSLALIVKAKLVAVEDGITTVEKEFLAHIALPGGELLGDRLLPEVQRMAQTGELPALGFARAIELPASIREAV